MGFEDASGSLTLSSDDATHRYKMFKVRIEILLQFEGDFKFHRYFKKLGKWHSNTCGKFGQVLLKISEKFVKNTELNFENVENVSSMISKCSRRKVNHHRHISKR